MKTKFGSVHKLEDFGETYLAKGEVVEVLHEGAEQDGWLKGEVWICDHNGERVAIEKEALEEA